MDRTISVVQTSRNYSPAFSESDNGRELTFVLNVSDKSTDEKHYNLQ